jgi:hypothetical protein
MFKRAIVAKPKLSLKCLGCGCPGTFSAPRGKFRLFERVSPGRCPGTSAKRPSLSSHFRNIQGVGCVQLQGNGFETAHELSWHHRCVELLKLNAEGGFKMQHLKNEVCDE